MPRPFLFWVKGLKNDEVETDPILTNTSTGSNGL
jgi:hypothetical protein